MNLEPEFASLRRPLHQSERADQGPFIRGIHLPPIIDEFVTGRLRSYYLANPDVTVNALRMYQEDQKVQELSPASAVICHVSVTKIAIKSALLKSAKL